MYGLDAENPTATALAVVESNGKHVAMAQSVDPMAGFIERAALDPNFNVEKFAQLLQLQRQDRADGAERSFNASMRQAQQDMPAIFRSSRNGSTNSNFATLEDVLDAIVPVITRSGFSMSFGTDVSSLPGHYGVTCIVSHVDGHSRHYRADVPADMLGLKGNANKTATHGFGSALSYGRRYLCLMIFNITLTNSQGRSDDDDGNAAGAKHSSAPDRETTITQQQAANISDLLEQKGATGQRLLAFFGIETFAQLPASKYETAVSMIKAFQPANGGSK